MSEISANRANGTGHQRTSELNKSAEVQIHILVIFVLAIVKVYHYSILGVWRGAYHFVI